MSLDLQHSSCQYHHMTSWVGKSIAHYRVTSPLGSGGMGEVYRATDSRLGREVAIKLLPASFATDAERMARFAREAKVLASLTHPNIASIYGLEEIEGVQALVMELVEGPTLAQRIEQGPMPADEVLPIARQIAEALEYAHEHSIIHRDLKPANIKLTAEGAAKVLDFGLAKALSDESLSSSPDLTHSPTLMAASTRLGVILGTAAYMSPEQAKGKTVDRRADIWSFGVVLFEMLSGKRNFVAETASETLAAVMKDEPEWSTLPAATPVRLTALVRRCLVKDPRQRLRDIGEARILIEQLMSGAPEPATSASSSTEVTPRRNVLRVVLTVGSALLLGAIGYLAGHFLGVTDRVLPIRATIELPAGAQLDRDNCSVVLSPDGNVLVFAAVSPGGEQVLWRRPLESATATILAGTEGATYPFGSPDGRFVAFFAEGKLKRTPAIGGVVQTICDALDGRGGTWSRAGVIVFSPGPLEGLKMVAASGGAPSVLTTIEQNGRSDRLPHFLPDSKRILYFSGGVEGDTNSVYCLDLASKRKAKVLDVASEARYMDPGYLVFVRDGDLLAQAFDAGSLQLAGEPALLAENVHFNEYRFTGNYSLSASGRFVYLTGATVGPGQLTWFDLDGRELEKVGQPAPMAQFDISPDGRRVASTVRTDRFDVHVLEIASGMDARLTFESEPAAYPIWSPDGSTLAYADGYGTIRLRPADGTAAGRVLYHRDQTSLFAADWSPDGSTILLWIQQPQTGMDIWSLPLRGPPNVQPLLETKFNEGAFSFSPDGRWLLYGSEESGRLEVYAATFPDLGSRRQVSSEGSGLQAAWSADGRRIYYSTPDMQLMAVDITLSGSSLSLGAKKQIFGGRALPGLWGLAPDGKRLLVLVPTEAPSSALHFVSDWRTLVESP